MSFIWDDSTGIISSNFQICGTVQKCLLIFQNLILGICLLKTNSYIFWSFGWKNAKKALTFIFLLIDRYYVWPFICLRYNSKRCRIFAIFVRFGSYISRNWITLTRDWSYSSDRGSMYGKSDDNFKDLHEDSLDLDLFIE